MKQKKSSKKKAAPAAAKAPEVQAVSAQEQQAAASQKNTVTQPVSGDQLERRDQIKVVLFSLLLLATTTIQTSGMSMLLAGIAILGCIGKKPLANVRAALSVAVVGFLVYAVMTGLAAIYSPFDAYATAEYYKFVAASALAVILLTRFEKKHVRGLLWGFVAVCAVIAIISIDAASHSGIFRAYNSVTSLLGADHSNILAGSSNRVNGYYNDANITASMFALGCFVSMYLVRTEKTLKKLLPAYLLLGILAQAFFLSMSRGAILCFALALLVWLVAARGERVELFFLMFFSAAVTVVLSIPAMRAVGTPSMLPNLLAVLTGVGIFALDWMLGRRLSAVVGKHAKAAGVAIAVIGILCVGYLVAGLNVTSPYTFEKDGLIDRVVTLEAGEYTLSGDWDGSVRMVLQINTGPKMGPKNWERLLDTYVEDTVQISVPQSGEVHIRIWGDAGQELREMVFSDGTKVKLNQPLLPEFLASRMRGNLFSSSSFVLRAQFMIDAWKLFLQAPIAGHGLGSTQGLYLSVQPYYYESLYVHSHVLQVMSDMGILGLLPFLALLLGSLWLLLRRLRKENDPLAVMLLVCWVMMNAHGLMEINFSIRGYQCLAYILLMLTAILYGGLDEKNAKMRELSEKGSLVLTAGLCLYFAVFGGLLMGHRSVENEMYRIQVTGGAFSMEGLDSYIKKDVFDQEENKISYVANAVILEDGRYMEKADRYAAQLRKSGTLTACVGMAQHYYLAQGNVLEAIACCREGIAQRVSDGKTWDLFFAFCRDRVSSELTEEQLELFVAEVLGTVDMLEEFNRDRVEEVVLSEETLEFVELLREIRSGKFSGEEALTQLHMLSAFAQLK